MGRGYCAAAYQASNFCSILKSQNIHAAAGAFGPSPSVKEGRPAPLGGGHEERQRSDDRGYPDRRGYSKGCRSTPTTLGPSWQLKPTSDNLEPHRPNLVKFHRPEPGQDICSWLPSLQLASLACIILACGDRFPEPIHGTLRGYDAEAVALGPAVGLVHPILGEARPSLGSFVSS